MKPTEEHKPLRGEKGGAEVTNPTVSYEGEDVRVSSIEGAGLILALTIAVSLAVCAGAFYLLTRQSPADTPQVSPLLRPQREQLPPLPRMQGIPGDVLSPSEQQRRFQEAAEQNLNSYRWVDQEKGIVHIPIAEALKIIAAKGLPPVPPASKVEGTPRGGAKHGSSTASKELKQE